MAMGTRKIGPAIAAGCTMVLKPAALTPLSSLALAQILIDAGLPPGVLNVITTSRSRAPPPDRCIADPRLRKLSFTGSTEVGKRLIRRPPSRCSGCRWSWAATPRSWCSPTPTSTPPSTAPCWPRCATGARPAPPPTASYVQRPVAEEFAARLAERMGSLKVGRGTEEGVGVGPLIDDRQRAKVARLVDDAVAKGARVLCGGARAGRARLLLRTDRPFPGS